MYMFLLLTCINTAALLRQACLVVCLHTFMHASKGALCNRSLCSIAVYVFQGRVTYLQTTSHAPVGGRAARVASTTGRLNAQHTTTSSPLPQRPKTVLDYRAALSSGNQPPLPYQAAFKSRPALGAPGTQLYAARQAS